VFDRIVKEANDAIIVAEIKPEAGPGFRIIYTNDAFTRIFGYSSEDVMGRSPRMLQGPETCAETIREISSVIHGGRSIRRRLLNYTKAGQPIWVDVNIVPLPTYDGQVRRFAAIERDVTSDVHRERQLEELAYADPLTKLANRRYLERVLDGELSRARRFRSPLSLAILDLDRFKFVNDTWGHPVGDRVLVAVARSILHSVRRYDHVARMGGEEFAVLLPGTTLPEAADVIRRICADVRAHGHVIVGSQTIMVTCSAGISSFGDAQDTVEKVISRADQALYTAKNMGRNRVAILEPDGIDASSSLRPIPARVSSTSQ
jgi:diguanylate cyclase (GGDEF)-like protein/PAS domain S-box-containing protein